MLTNKVVEKEYSKEFEACKEYTEKWITITIKQKVKQLLFKPVSTNSIP